jgi:hypothetical protein
MNKTTNHNYTSRVRRLVYEHLVVQRRLTPKGGYVVDGVQREMVTVLLPHLTHQRSPKKEVMAHQSRGCKKGEMKNLETHGCW